MNSVEVTGPSRVERENGDNVDNVKLLDRQGRPIQFTECLIFPNLWESILKHASNEEILSSFKDVQSTMGIIGALLLSVIYGRVGRSEDINLHSVWGGNHDIGEAFLTIVNNTNIFLCLFVTISAARTYIMLSCFPTEQGRKTAAKFGPFFTIDLPYILMAPITAMIVLDTLLRTSLTLPCTLGIVVLCVSFAAVSFAIYLFRVLDFLAVESIVSVVSANDKSHKTENKG